MFSALIMRSGTASVGISGVVTIESGSSDISSYGNIEISVGFGFGAGGTLSASGGDATVAGNDGEAAYIVTGSLFTTGNGSLTQQELGIQLEEIQQLMVALGPRLLVGFVSIPQVKAWPV